MLLTSEEIKTVNNSNFLISKNKIMSEMELLLNSTKAKLNSIILDNGENINLSVDIINNNISKGENYRGLPFAILDFPNIFKKNHVFAYRTMFWWGNYFSSTLHLQGKYLDFFRNQLICNFEMLLNKNIFICVNDTPWEYHFDKDNYVEITEEHIEIIKTKLFIKLSKKIPLESYSSVPEFALSYFSTLLKVLTT